MHGSCEDNPGYDPMDPRDEPAPERWGGPPVHYCNDCDCYPCICDRLNPEDDYDGSGDSYRSHRSHVPWMQTLTR